MNPQPEHHSAIDVSQYYRAWADLWSFGLRMGGCEEAGDDAAWQRTLRGHQRSLAERDAAVQRIIDCLNRASHAR